MENGLATYCVHRLFAPHALKLIDAEFGTSWSATRDWKDFIYELM